MSHLIIAIVITRDQMITHFTGERRGERIEIQVEVHRFLIVSESDEKIDGPKHFQFQQRISIVVTFTDSYTMFQILQSFFKNLHYSCNNSN